MGNPFVHIELNTGEVGDAKKFYKKLFDWKLEDMPMGPGQSYTMLDVGKDGVGGGMQKKPMAEAPTQWIPYVEVKSVKETVEKAGKLGAKVMLPFMEIGEMGSIGIFVDPTGATIGVWAQATKKEKKKAKKEAKAAKKEAKKDAAKKEAKTDAKKEKKSAKK